MTWPYTENKKGPAFAGPSIVTMKTTPIDIPNQQLLAPLHYH